MTPRGQTPQVAKPPLVVTVIVMMMMMMMAMGVTVVGLPASDVTVVTTATPSASAVTPTAVSQETTSSDTAECDEGLPPPDHPFKIVWNHADTCEKNNIPLHLDQYGFTFNQRRQFLGEEIETIYHTGHWPHINNSGAFIHGGLPQLFSHQDFNRTWEALGTYVRTNFTGLAILDFEWWRPMFDTNFSKLKKYQKQSMNLVKQRHPEYNETVVRQVAEQEFQEAAKRLMSTKLAIGQHLMPKGHWGYYGYPRTWGQNGNTPRQNNKVEWLWRQSTGLYPNIGMGNPNQTTSGKVWRVANTLTEAIRVQQAFSPPNTPIYPFGNFQQGDDIFFNEDHLKISLGLPADMGASGIVLWGSSSHYKHAGRQCNRLTTYLSTVLGPFVKNLTQVMLDCSKQLCSGRGRCVHNSHDVLVNETMSKVLSGSCTPRSSRFRDYHCRCYSHWTGACCDIHKRSPCRKPYTPGVDLMEPGQNPNGNIAHTTPDPHAAGTSTSKPDASGIAGRLNETLIG